MYLKFFVHSFCWVFSFFDFPSPLCSYSLAMLFSSSSTQPHDSEVPIKLIVLEITIGFGFLSMTRSQEGPYTVGKIRNTEQHA